MGAAITRAQIVEVADRLFYEQGFEATSFADIAAAVRLSRGNFYYHFRTKDDLLGAVIALRLANTEAMLDGWEGATPDPVERIRSFVRILIMNRARIMLYGCPVGTLCDELSKLRHVAKDDAAKLFMLFRRWLSLQFAALGREADADALALHALMRSQGIATLATAFQDEGFIQREVEDLLAWVEAQRPHQDRPTSETRPQP
ncbi:TetR/AcrR family transcriptional regulator [Azospirillum sp. RWY-5-1]|uniref:TetR/AcrR family transcriptional regulator n=1 Tax=Azospirillum oleiclasticum TaxID=2735135 RepID=A0ABX2T8E8_9PROT|nr:TetR/AcrR family transcriptional regulator [Azospirillum oleiclasticum]NYZ11790.1 TetR/AcrR family transcriptional regulator [Azospirillum oleiclasticum]NYZ18950.1 TetR/AcrR family transcriptional regulator [Azospirillum oleiclasticum]